MASLAIHPSDPDFDTELRIEVTGLPPGAPVTLRSAMPREGELWTASVELTADADGTAGLRPGRDDPMALIWSMRPAGTAGRSGAAGVCAAPAGPLDPVPLRISALLGGVEVAGGSVLRRRIPDGLVRTEVTDDGLVGVMYSPGIAPGRPTRGVVLLGGAEGGLHEVDAALLAGRGHTVLALAYFGVPGVPSTLHDIPLEYFERAVDLMEAWTGGGAVLVGGSKGGEAALLVGSRDPRVHGVVSVVGSGLTTQGIAGDVVTGSFLDILATPAASWTVNGEPLPFIPSMVGAELEARVAAREPVRLRDAYLPGLAAASPELIEACTIPVERINGPVLLISGEDDQGYGREFHCHGEARLRAKRHPHPWEHLVHRGAGHLIAGPPHLPATVSQSPGPGVVFEHGGTPEATAGARAATWHRILAFLAQRR